MSNLRKQWNDTCKACGIKPISIDTAARIMAIVYAYDRESITHNDKLKADIEYIQDEYNIKGGCVPSSEFCSRFKEYSRQIEDNDYKPTDWAVKLMKENYNITL